MQLKNSGQVFSFVVQNALSHLLPFNSRAFDLKYFFNKSQHAQIDATLTKT